MEGSIGLKATKEMSVMERLEHLQGRVSSLEKSVEEMRTRLNELYRIVGIKV